jgi:hypothetical protein
VKSTSSVEEIINNTKHNVNVNKTNTNNVINVRATALKLVDRLHDSDSFKFFCMVAWNLPESVIWNSLELAQAKGREPKKYFSFLCKMELDKKDSLKEVRKLK